MSSHPPGGETVYCDARKMPRLGALNRQIVVRTDTKRASESLERSIYLWLTSVSCKTVELQDVMAAQNAEDLWIRFGAIEKHSVTRIVCGEISGVWERLAMGFEDERTDWVKATPLEERHRDYSTSRTLIATDILTTALL